MKRSSKSTDFILADDSILEDVELDFEAIEYENVNLEQLSMHALGSLVTLDAKILSKQRKTINQKTLDTYAIADNSGTSKLTVWEESVKDLVNGKVYKLTDVRIKKNPFGNIELVVGKNSKVELSNTKLTTGKVVLDPSFIAIKGEVMKVDDVRKYKMCNSCHKKVGAAVEGVVTCESEGCRGTVIKEKFCEDGMYAKIVFFSENKDKLALTMFKDEIKVLVPNAEMLDAEAIKNVLIRSSEMSITKSKQDIVTSIMI